MSFSAAETETRRPLRDAEVEGGKNTVASFIKLSPHCVVCSLTAHLWPGLNAAALLKAKKEEEVTEIAISWGKYG